MEARELPHRRFFRRALDLLLAGEFLAFCSLLGCPVFRFLSAPGEAEEVPGKVKVATPRAGWTTRARLTTSGKVTSAPRR